MLYFDENRKPISKDKIDLSKGKLIDITIISEKAAPIDNITKFAWADEDYETAKMYIINKEIANEPTQLDKLEANIAYLAMLNNCLEDIVL